MKTPRQDWSLLVEGYPNRTAIRGHVGADWALLATASPSPVRQAD
jgi:hypothetical protein